MKYLSGWMIAVLVLGLGSLALAEEKAKPKPQTRSGELTKVEGNSLTLTQRGDQGERSETFTLAADTRVLIETAEDETVTVKGEGGDRSVTRPRLQEGKLADLKTGQRISVTFSEDKKVTQVIGHRAAKPKKKEGNG